MVVIADAVLRNAEGLFPHGEGKDDGVVGIAHQALALDKATPTTLKLMPLMRSTHPPGHPETRFAATFVFITLWVRLLTSLATSRRPLPTVTLFTSKYVLSRTPPCPGRVAPLDGQSSASWSGTRPVVDPPDGANVVHRYWCPYPAVPPDRMRDWDPGVRNRLPEPLP